MFQIPLQPLADNLDSSTYAIFEEDSVKYDLYREAISHAIEDLVQIIADERSIVVYLLGAGRGPLVNTPLFVISCCIDSTLFIFALLLVCKLFNIVLLSG